MIARLQLQHAEQKKREDREPVPTVEQAIADVKKRIEGARRKRDRSKLPAWGSRLVH